MNSDHILACPECGLPVAHSCHHDGESYRSIPMHRIDALHKLYDSIEELTDQASAMTHAAHTVFADLIRKDCPYDTDGDGDCGKAYCPHCGQGALS